MLKNYIASILVVIQQILEQFNFAKSKNLYYNKCR